MTHSQLVHDIRLELSGRGAVVWPNVNAVLQSTEGRKMRTGLTPGASDLIGIAENGLFLAIEVKVGRDTLKPHQQRFLELVQKRGGRAGEARSVEDAIKIARGL